MSGEMVVHDALSPVEMKEQVTLIQEVMKIVMKKDVHYGTIPGCGDKPTLLKPGAEKLSFTFRLAPKYEIEIVNHKGGHREYEVICNMYHIKTEEFVGSGVGHCSTLESKYRYRTQSTGREVPSDYWTDRDPDKLGGSQYSAKKIKNCWMIMEKIEHDNPADYYNTAKKMAKKRAHVDAVLTATAASDIFTQDIEDMGEVMSSKQEPESIEKPKAVDPQAPAPSGGDSKLSPQVELHRKLLIASSMNTEGYNELKKQFTEYKGNSVDVISDATDGRCKAAMMNLAKAIKDGSLVPEPMPTECTQNVNSCPKIKDLYFCGSAIPQGTKQMYCPYGLEG